MRKASFAWPAVALLAVFFLLAVGAGGRRDQDALLTTRDVVTGFRAATGEKLVADATASTTGRYAALGLAYRSASKLARYGVFTVYVVTDGDLETAVTELLADGATGSVAEPDRRGIHWEAGTTLQGRRYWLAKKRYGANVVLWWFGTKERRPDATFRRLDRALAKVVRERRPPPA
jgi:hypothetical protein